MTTFPLILLSLVFIDVLESFFYLQHNWLHIFQSPCFSRSQFAINPLLHNVTRGHLSTDHKVKMFQLKSLSSPSRVKGRGQNMKTILFGVQDRDFSWVCDSFLLQWSSPLVWPNLNLSPCSRLITAPVERQTRHPPPSSTPDLIITSVSTSHDPASGSKSCLVLCDSFC